METPTTPKSGKLRKTLIQLTSETKPKDPAAFANHQVAELDKTAKNSIKRRKQCNDQIESDLARIKSLEDQIAMINARYLPLCESLEAAKERRKHLVKMLESGSEEEKKLRGGAKITVRALMTDESKISRSQASQVLESCRGFGMGLESTFHQNRGKSETGGEFGSTNNFNATGRSTNIPESTEGGDSFRGGVALPKIGKK